MPQSYEQRRKRARLVVELDRDDIKKQLKQIAANQDTDVRRLVLIALVAAYPELQDAIAAELSFSRAEVYEQSKATQNNAEAVSELEMELSADDPESDTPLIFD